MTDKMQKNRIVKTLEKKIISNDFLEFLCVFVLNVLLTWQQKILPIYLLLLVIYFQNPIKALNCNYDFISF